MTIKVGDQVPDVRLKHMTAGGPAEITAKELFKGKTVALFALPGAFTPTCSARHVPGFLAQHDALKAKGVSVNDAFVMGAWGKDQQVGDRILMLADGSAEFTRAAGLDQDLTANGMGVRSKRYAMIVKDGVVTHLAVEPAPGLDVSSAEATLKAL
jgi:peroxiredoxin (alkyl hydroperoxide reductase subunit C)